MARFAFSVGKNHNFPHACHRFPLELWKIARSARDGSFGCARKVNLDGYGFVWPSETEVCATIHVKSNGSGEND